MQWPEASQSIAVFDVEGIPIPTASRETLIASNSVAIVYFMSR